MKNCISCNSEPGRNPSSAYDELQGLNSLLHYQHGEINAVWFAAQVDDDIPGVAAVFGSHDLSSAYVTNNNLPRIALNLKHAGRNCGNRNGCIKKIIPDNDHIRETKSTVKVNLP